MQISIIRMTAARFSVIAFLQLGEDRFDLFIGDKSLVRIPLSHPS